MNSIKFVVFFVSNVAYIAHCVFSVAFSDLKKCAKVLASILLMFKFIFQILGGGCTLWITDYCEDKRLA